MEFWLYKMGIRHVKNLCQLLKFFFLSTCQTIGLEEHLQYDLFSVDLTQSINSNVFFFEAPSPYCHNSGKNINLTNKIKVTVMLFSKQPNLAVSTQHCLSLHP